MSARQGSAPEAVLCVGTVMDRPDPARGGHVVISALLLALVILVLMEYVFPWADRYSPWAESTIGLVQWK